MMMILIEMDMLMLGDEMVVVNGVVGMIKEGGNLFEEKR